MTQQDWYESIGIDGGAVGAVGGEGHQIYQYIVVQGTDDRHPDLATLHRAYLEHIRRTYQHLDFKGIPQVERVASLLPLEGLYVGLLARRELPEGETWARVAGRALDEGLLEEAAERDTARMERRAEMAELVPVERLLEKSQGLVVLGDPGAGKSTLLKRMALACAEGRADGWLGLPADLLPILIPLAAYARSQRTHECCLADFLGAYYRVRGLPDGMAYLFLDALARGQALVLLDGLDEVLENRTFVVDRVEEFFRQHALAGNRLVVTSRIVGYRDAPLRAEGLTTVTLVDFGRDQIEQFAYNWCHAFEVATRGDTPEAHAAAEKEKAELLETVFSNPGVERLASNPLLLTVLALIKRQGVTLPHRRVELYELYLKTLISAWSQARALDRRPVGPELDYLETARVLGPLALWLRETNPGAGLARHDEVLRWLTEYYQGDEWGMVPGEARQRARGFLDAVRRYSNLLIERGEGVYGFIHLTFEEYLAARGVVQCGELELNRSIDLLLAHLDDPAWHEMTLLTVGYIGIVQGNRLPASAIIERLLAEERAGEGRGWNVVVAGEALRDVGAMGVTDLCRGRVVESLVATMQDTTVRSDYRRKVGLLLGRLGWVPDDLDTWIEIPAGRFLYGAGREERVIERAFRIAKYPVTNLQYARFVQAGGYEEKKHWSPEGLAWRSGESDDEIKESFYRDWVKRRPPEARNRPWFWRDPERANPLIPVVGVSWFEAEAYCRWLTGELRRAGMIGTAQVARLPVEVEWERAARGADGREYPWGVGFDVSRCNLKIGPHPANGTTAVCTYPGGASPEGLWDCSGNVWEWTGSWYRKGETRVLRGGSWASDFEWLARCAWRDFFHPASCNVYVGLRVVVGSPSPPANF
ncbi:MAG: SUMF1/EgtB/PvdO family nonheme iron enzyme [Anaerolineae bacterium]|nr:SUMF1/EgtB/PvdO family nonheme iron enzyme [Anaerolineae bacterium]